MKKFAKLIDLENDEQVLITINYNQESDEYEVIRRTDFIGFTVEIKSIHPSEKDAINALENYSIKQAVVFRSMFK